MGLDVAPETIYVSGGNVRLKPGLPDSTGLFEE